MPYVNKKRPYKKEYQQGGKNSDGVTVQSKSKNRSFKRSSSRKLVSETSTRERKKSVKRKTKKVKRKT